MTDLFWALYSGGYIMVAVIMLLIAKIVFDILTPYSVNEHLSEKDNPAVGILVTGFLLGVAAIICGVFIGDGPDKPTFKVFFEEIQQVGIYGAVGIIFLLLTSLIGDRVILHRFSNRKEIVDMQNTAVATVMAMKYIATGLIIAGGIFGSVNIISLVFAFVAGQLLLIVFSRIYQLMTAYDIHKELGKKQNIAAGIAFGGNLVAYGLILMKGLSMNPQLVEQWNWTDKLMNIGYYGLAGCILLFISRVVTDFLFLPKARISKEISKDRNINAGLLEAGLALTMGSAMVFCL